LLEKGQEEIRRCISDRKRRANILYNVQTSTSVATATVSALFHLSTHPVSAVLSHDVQRRDSSLRGLARSHVLQEVGVPCVLQNAELAEEVWGESAGGQGDVIGEGLGFYGDGVAEVQAEADGTELAGTNDGTDFDVGGGDEEVAAWDEKQEMEGQRKREREKERKREREKERKREREKERKREREKERKREREKEECCDCRSKRNGELKKREVSKSFYRRL